MTGVRARSEAAFPDAGLNLIRCEGCFSTARLGGTPNALIKHSTKKPDT